MSCLRLLVELGLPIKWIDPAWFPFEGSARKRMASSCPPKDRSGTTSTVWQWTNGEQPSVADGAVQGLFPQLK